MPEVECVTWPPSAISSSAIKDPDARTLPALGKAVQLARAFGAKLELFHAITESVLIDTRLYSPEDYEHIRHDTRTRYR